VALACVAITVAACVNSPSRNLTSNPTPSALDAATSLVGTYTGASTTYFVDADGTVKRQCAFSEQIEARDPVLRDGKAFVSVTDIQTYDSDKCGDTTKRIHWTEGFYVNADGSAGAHYFLVEIPNVPASETIERSIGGGGITFDSDATYTVDQLGFAGKNVTYAKQTYVKNVVTNGLVETDVITQFSTVSWKAASGAIETMQFISLNGYQTRTLKPRHI
jgi:hypothetical protein